MPKKHDIPPEEGDFAREAIKRGLNPEEEKILRRDLEAVERGDGSSESITRGGSDPTSEIGRLVEEDRIRDAEYEHQELGREFRLENFVAFARDRGVSEAELSYDDLSYLLDYDTLPDIEEDNGEDIKRRDRARTLKTDWEAERKEH